MTRASRFIWTEGIVDRAVALYGEGKRGRQITQVIADEFGADIPTRALTGKLYRLRKPRPKAPPGVWADARVTDRLVQLFEDKFNTRHIAKVLSDEFSIKIGRFAVIGKLYRLGLQYPKQVAKPKSPRISIGGKPMQPLPWTPRVVDVEPRNISFAELEDGDCRYVCNEAMDASEFLWCGNPIKPGSPYCYLHHVVCMQPAKKKQERKAA